MGISFLVGQTEIDRYAALVDCRSGGGFLALDDPQQIALVDREVYVDRVDLIDQTKSGLLPHGADNVAGIDEVSADPAVEGRPHRCVTQIELGELDLGLGVENPGFRRFFLVTPLIHLSLRRGILFKQRRVAGKLGGGVPQRCLLCRQLGLRLLELGFVLVLLNREEQVALLHPGAVGEVIFFEIPFYSRDQGNRISRRGIAGKVEVVGDGLGRGFGDGNHRRRRGGTARVFATSAGSAGQSDGYQQPDCATPPKRTDEIRSPTTGCLLPLYSPHSHHSGSRTGGARSSGDGSPGASGRSKSGVSRVPQFVRSDISRCVSRGTKSRPSRICHPPPKAR